MRIDGYELERELARGGFGAVYRARETSSGRPVAIKVLLGAANTPQHKRFLREAEALARLSHSNLVRVHDVGEAEGKPYMVMELLEGRSLAEHLDDGMLEPEQAARWATELASALDHTHGRGVLHRDLKPSNVIVTPEGRAVLVDFGLTKSLDVPRDATQLTRTGHTLGTLGYLPPEQARGDRAAMGPASDVYGLGATLYAMLTGQAPHAGSSLVEVLTAALAPVVPPSELRPGLDPSLERICMACLDLEPAKRPTAAETAAKLEGWSQGVRDGRPVWPWLVGAALGLLLLAGGGVLRAGGDRPAVAPEQERLPAEVAPSPPPTPPTPTPAPGPARPPDSLGLRCLDAWGDRRGQTLGYVRSLALFGERLLSAGPDGVRSWDAETGEPLQTLDPAPSDAVAVSSSGRRLIFGRTDGTVWLYILDGGVTRRRLGVHEKTIEAAAFDPSETLALTASNSGANSLQVWDLADGTRRMNLDVKGGVFGAAFLGTDRIVTSDGGGVMQAWSVPSGKKLWQVRAGAGAGFGVSVSPDRRLLFTSTWQDKKVALWRLAADQAPTLVSEQLLERGVMQVQVQDGGRRVAAGGGLLQRWGAWPSGPAVVNPSETAPTTWMHWGLAVAPDGAGAWVGTKSGAIFRVDLGSGDHGVWARRGHVGAVSAVFECALGIASVATDRTLRVWTPGGVERVEARQEVAHDLFTASVHSGAVLVGNRWTADASLLTPGGTAAGPRTVVRSPQGLHAIALASTRSGVFVDGDGDLFAFGDRGAEQVETAPLEGHDSNVLSVAVDPQGPLAVSGGEDGTVRLWDRERRRQVGIFRGHEKPVHAVAFRGRGEAGQETRGRGALPELLSVGEDERLRRWDIASGVCAASLETGRAWGVASDSTGRRAVTWGVELRLWDLVADRELARFDLRSMGDRPSVAAFTADDAHLLVGTRLGVVYRFTLRGLE